MVIAIVNVQASMVAYHHGAPSNPNPVGRLFGDDTDRYAIFEKGHGEREPRGSGANLTGKVVSFMDEGRIS